MTIAGLAAGALLFGAGVAVAQARTPADDGASLVEDFSYPGAEQILAERGILLQRGDGHLLLVDCAVGADVIQVRSRSRDPFCFQAVAPGAWITMELPEAFLVFSDSRHTTVADYTVDGVRDSATVAPGGAVGIGEGETEGASAVLLKLTAS